ncbi:hypothetical protein BC827DRAFT_165206 [Russula dissimulans]|nr:hypothetical protein BC827DRAFT_165206 [Russula dissimulans]
MLGLVVPCPHLANPNFVQKVRHSIPPLASPSPHSYRRFTSQLKLVQQSPQLTQSLLSTDPRLIDVIGALMGLDVQGFGRPEGSDDLPPGVSPTFATPPTSPPPSSAKPTSPPKATPGTVSSSNINESEDVEMAEAEEEQVDEEEAAAKKAADAEKKLGADAYKKPDLAPAIEHFSNAWETWPKDITFLSNLAAAYFERGDYNKTIEMCQKAVDEGRSSMQITSSLQKHTTSLARPTPKGRPDRGDPLLQKVPHGTPHAGHPEQAQGCRACQGGRGPRGVHQSCAAREEGNQLFKEGDFTGAVKSYMESIKREPSDARVGTTIACQRCGRGDPRRPQVR